MEQPLNILIIEDSPTDFLLEERHLRQHGLSANCVRTDTFEELTRALDSDRWDLILTDYSVPRMDFHDSFAYLQSRVPDLPVILVSGSVGEEQAVELLKMGVWDFVIKDNLTRLVPAIQRSLREAEDRRARRAAEESMRESEYRFRCIFNSSPIAIGIGRRDDGRLVEVNDAWLHLYGFERHEVIGRTTSELNLYVRAEDRDDIVRKINECGRVINREVQLQRKSGEVMLALYSAELITLGEETFLQVMLTDITEQKRMETELRTSEEMYRSLFGNMLNGFAYCRMIFEGDTPLDFIYLSVNDAFEKQTGLKDVAGRRVSEVIPGIRESDPGLFEIYGRVVRTGTPEQLEIYVEALKEWFWISLYSPAGGHFVAIFDVITRRKLAEQALRESEQFNLQIINNAEEGIVVYGTDLRYRGWNPYMERLSGLPAHEVIGKHPLELFPFLKKVAFIERLENVLAGQAVSSTEFSFHSPYNGYSGWASDTCSPLKNATGEIIGIIGMVRDITARKQAEETLRKLYAAVEQSPTVVIITDRDGTIEFVNPRFCLASGYSSEEALGRNPRIQKGDTPPEVFRDMWATIGDGDVWEGDFHNRRKDGSLYWEHAIISPIRNDFGVITHFMAIKEDITERKLAAEELQRKNAEIEQFLYIVSHDLRSPLVTVKTFLGYLESDMTGTDQERISQDLQYIHGAADKMELLLNELLKISRIGRVETTPARVSLVQVLSEVLDTMAGIINERKVEVRLPEADVMLFVDHSHLFHIWQNLIENAIKYSRNDTIPRIEFGVQSLDGETLFFARDNGVGVDPKYHKKIFGIFEKLDHKSSGAGLGLSMIQRIVEKYGGRVWVESEGSGTGACFYFTLPSAMVKSRTIPD